jgi:hypothetical protein
VKIKFIASLIKLDQTALAIDVKTKKGRVIKVKVGCVDLGGLVVSEVCDFEDTCRLHDLVVVILLPALEARKEDIVCWLDGGTLESEILLSLVSNIMRSNSKEVLILCSHGISMVTIRVESWNESCRVVTFSE